MPTCSNCFNSCQEIISDKCIRYTGVAYESLSINNGDTQYATTQNIITALLTALDGTGIIPTVEISIICDLVDGYLPVSGDITIVDYIVALIKAVCDLQTQVTTNTDAITALNADYNVDCLSGVVNSDDTHEVVQAIIDKLCALSTSFSALALALPTTYVSLSDLNTLIQAYLDSISSGAAIKNRMVPYSAVPYFGSLTYFDITGAGTGDWDRVFLCNGQNGTPDLRGRVIVSVTNVAGGGAYDTEVDPGVAGNPNYTIDAPNNTFGSNNVTLTAAQMPTHSHATSVVSTATAHTHETVRDDASDVSLSSTTPIRVQSTFAADYTLRGTSGVANIGQTSSETVVISNNVTNPTAGSGDSHNNIQPVYASYFIIYIP